MAETPDTMVRAEQADLVYYQFATLLAEAPVRHAFFTRLGGVSRSPYAGLNVGASVGDDPEAVAENRRRCFAALGYTEAQVVSPHQVHSTKVARVRAAEGGSLIAATDGLVSDEQGLALFLRFADCTPIMLYDPQHRAVGLVHAGWRGTLDGMATAGVEAMRRHFCSEPGDLWAGIGPCIGPCCYEVDDDLGARFAVRFGEGVLARPRPGRPYLDLIEANAIALREAGVWRIERAGLCTACHVEEFFSHRRENGQTGRLAVLIGLEAGV